MATAERLHPLGAALALSLVLGSVLPTYAAETPPAESGEVETTDVAELISALARFRIESLAAAERRAVLSRGEELFLVSPGDPVPGLDQSRIEAVHPERLVVLLPDAKTAILTSGRTGEVLVEWIDGNPPIVPPLMLPVAIVSEPDVTEPGVEIRNFSAADSGAANPGAANPREDGP